MSELHSNNLFKAKGFLTQEAHFFFSLRKGDSQTDGQTGSLLGPIYVGYHSNSCTMMTGAWCCRSECSHAASQRLQTRDDSARPQNMGCYPQCICRDGSEACGLGRRFNNFNSNISVEIIIVFYLFIFYQVNIMRLLLASELDKVWSY